VQTIVITLTLLVFIFQFRSQERAIKESSYQNLMGRYNDFMLMQAEKPELSNLMRGQRDLETMGYMARELFREGCELC
jgi:hypothetical protein